MSDHLRMGLTEAGFWVDIEAKARGALGAERAATRANKVEPGWIDRAAEAVRDEVKLWRGPTLTDGLPKSAWSTAHRIGWFTFETIRLYIDGKISPPPDGRAWGQVVKRCIKLGYIVPTFEYAPAVSSNGSPKRLYRRGPSA